MNRIKVIKEMFMDVIYPRKCVACENVLEMRSYRKLRGDEIFNGLCNKCRKAVKYVENPVCMKCGKPIQNSEKEYCYDCEKNQHIYDMGIAVFEYCDEIKKAVYRLKYENYKIYGAFFGEEMAKKYGNVISDWNVDAIIPVPIHAGRMKKRGYNQAELIARRLSELTGIREDDYILERVKNTLPQKELGNNFRKKNIENAFKVIKNVVKYNKVILVDDIYTTGCTIDECARVLKEAGVKEVYFVTICIGQGI